MSGTIAVPLDCTGDSLVAGVAPYEGLKAQNGPGTNNRPTETIVNKRGLYTETGKSSSYIQYSQPRFLKKL